MVTMTELPRNLSILALQKSLGKLAFLVFVHTGSEKCFYVTQCKSKSKVFTEKVIEKMSVNESFGEVKL